MATITEDYVSFETAKLLKEKGFNEALTKYWDNEGGSNTIPSICEFDDCSWRNSELNKREYSCPTLQMAMKWLREVHGTSIEITSTGYLVDNDVEWECDIKAGHRLYFKHITCEKSFESVAEKALKYCLEYLI